MSRLTSRTSPDTTSVGFTYTPTGRRATASDARGVTSYAYGTRDRVVATVYPDGRELDYAYDARGARTKLTAKVGASVLTTTTRYDASGRAIEIADPTGRKTTLAYDAARQRTALIYPNGTTTSYTYDTRGRVARIHAGADATDVTSFAYTMDAAGRRTRIDELAGVTRTYGYDGIDRLTSEAVTGSLAYVKTFAYDPVGNRLTQTTTGAGADIVTYGYDMRDRLLVENTTSYAYDANGNTTSKSGEATYTWDFEDRLVGVSTTESGTVANDYDVDGTRVRTTVTSPTPGADGVKNLLVDTTGGLSHVVAETGAAGTLTALYVRDGDELLAVMRPADTGTWTTRWIHHDVLGSVRALTDEAGVVVDARGYEAFGTKNVEAGSDPLPYAFAGEPFENASKLAYHRARWVDARLGRFFGIDPLVHEGPSRGVAHLFVYSDDDPLGRTDPSGNESMASVTVTVSITGLGATIGEALPSVIASTATAVCTAELLASALGGDDDPAGAASAKDSPCRLNPISVFTAARTTPQRCVRVQASIRHGYRCMLAVTEQPRATQLGIIRFSARLPEVTAASSSLDFLLSSSRYGLRRMSKFTEGKRETSTRPRSSSTR